MRINRMLYDEILNSVRNCFPEMGGILGGTKGIVEQVYYDDGIGSEKKCSYSPYVSVLNKVLWDWKKRNIEFYGMFHTHCYGGGTLSLGDKRYIKVIMENMPEQLDKLYFPVIVFPQKEMLVYVAIRKQGQLIIKEEELLFE